MQLENRYFVEEYSPYHSGQRLWVREPFNVVYYGGHYYSIGNVKSSNETFAIICKATPGHYTEIDVTDKNHPHYEQLYRLSDSGPDGNKFRPSIFMPRWASRILLEVAEVRIERLQDISHGDALSEGVLNYTDWMTPEYKAQCEAARINGTKPPLGYPPRQRFQHLWDSINSKHPAYSWDANPFVWVISYKRIEP